MQVARIHGGGDLRLHDEPDPTPRAGEALVKVTVVGVCGSDVHWFREGRIGGDAIRSPLVLGHECAGVIESGPRKGERVAIDPAIPCGRCEYCEEGKPNLCSALRFAGHAPQDGAMRPWIAWPETSLVSLPDALSYVEGAMLEPLGVALYSVDLGGVGPVTSVGVFGCGTIGLSVIQVARAAGATRIFATDLPDVLIDSRPRARAEGRPSRPAVVVRPTRSCVPPAAAAWTWHSRPPAIPPRSRRRWRR
jgi:L-iditol 2-dehydrogenase